MCSLTNSNVRMSSASVTPIGGDAAGPGQSGERLGLSFVELLPGVRNDKLNPFAALVKLVLR
jgi:hypothetical protein